MSEKGMRDITRSLKYIQKAVREYFRELYSKFDDL